jgi:hypothetical protein
MSRFENLELSIAITRLNAGAYPQMQIPAEHFAIWVLKAPYPSGYVHHDRIWPAELNQVWQSWQQLFSTLPIKSLSPIAADPPAPLSVEPALPASTAGQSLSSRLMQQLGINLWQWLFDGSIQNSFTHSRGMAQGQTKPLRLRLEIRDPHLIGLPWELMQPQAGKPAISLDPQLLFSRTTSDVDRLTERAPAYSLNILLVLGQDSLSSVAGTESRLRLNQEAETLVQILKQSTQAALNGNPGAGFVPCQVDTLIQPTAAELITRLETGHYNIFFYAGHGEPAPAGGQLMLRPDATLSGTELAQVLVSNGVTLAVFNACWGSMSDQHNNVPTPRSSLAEVLIHHGVPAVVAMRDSIADTEALSFISIFAQALAEGMPVDRAVAVARQQLLTVYKFNQPAWTLPVLYMHPEFDGELIEPVDEISTELPNSPTWMGHRIPTAFLRLAGIQDKVWPVRGNLMRVGRLWENDLVLQERWVSQRHAEIFCRDNGVNGVSSPTYFLKDFSRFGTMILMPAGGWQKVHHQEVPLQSGTQLKFGSSQGQTWDFIIETPNGGH